MFLGLDLGTSALKATVIDAEGRVHSEAQASLSRQSPFPGASEQNPADWFAALVVALGQLDFKDQVQAIGLSGQMHGAVLLDAQLRVLGPVMLWNDGRAQREARELAGLGLAGVAGVKPMAGLTGPKLLWLARHAAGAHGQIRHVLSPKDWLGFCLHGRLISDPSDAAGTWLWDQAGARWSEALCAACTVGPAWLPDVVSSTTVVGHLTAGAEEKLGLPKGIPVVAGAGDTVAAALAIGAIKPGRAFLGISTSGQVLKVVDRYEPPQNGSTAHHFAHGLPGLWYQMAAMLNGASSLAWLADLVGRTLPDLLAEAESAKGSPLILPYLMGERTPYDAPDARAAITGLGHTTTAADLMRGMIDSIACTYADAAEVIGGVENPIATGGGTRSDLLMQAIANALGTEVLRPRNAALGAAVGAAKLAAVGIGALGLDDLAEAPEDPDIFTPDPAQKAHFDQRRGEMRALFARGVDFP